jgi:hypothetical protein
MRQLLHSSKGVALDRFFRGSLDLHQTSSIIVLSTKADNRMKMLLVKEILLCNCISLPGRWYRVLWCNGQHLPTLPILLQHTLDRQNSRQRLVSCECILLLTAKPHSPTDRRQCRRRITTAIYSGSAPGSVLGRASYGVRYSMCGCGGLCIEYLYRAEMGKRWN